MLGDPHERGRCACGDLLASQAQRAGDLGDTLRYSRRAFRQLQRHCRLLRIICPALSAQLLRAELGALHGGAQLGILVEESINRGFCVALHDALHREYAGFIVRHAAVLIAFDELAERVFHGAPSGVERRLAAEFE